MRRLVQILGLWTCASVLAVYSNHGAALPDSQSCSSSVLHLKLEASSMPECRQIDLEGRFTLDICTPGAALLISETSIVRILERTPTDWISRREWQNESLTESISEVFTLPTDLSGFALSRVISNQKHAVIGKILCEGRIFIEN